MIKFRLIIGFAVSCIVWSQIPVQSWGTRGDENIYKYFQKRKDASERIVYSNWDGKSKEIRPAMIWLQGSNRDSMVSYRKNQSDKVDLRGPGEFMSLAPNKFWLFAMEKRGIKSFDTEKTGELSQEVNTYNTMDYRTHEAAELLKYVGKLKNIDNKKIIVVGYSEGTDVVLGAITSSKIPTHAGYFSGSGTSQMFDLLVLSRKGYVGDLKKTANVLEKEKNVEKCIEAYHDILKNPDAIDKEFEGLPYRRWATFFKCEPDKLFLKVHIPVFIAHGTVDESVPVESIDFLQAQMVMHGKKNITFKRYPGLNHHFFACAQDNESMDKADDSLNHKSRVYQDFLKWLSEH